MKKITTVDGRIVYQFKRTWIYAEDIIAALAVIVIFLLGFIMVQLGKEMDAEVERQHQAEMLQIAKDELVNYKVTH
jgi:uncharacterized membrane-anchored protein YhcB (DUF1043 family)